MVGRIEEERWLPCAEGFLNGYDRPETVELMKPLLAIPKLGLPRLWWRVRTTFMAPAVVRRRFAALERLPVVSSAAAAAVY
jgi:hypothetical protein